MFHLLDDYRDADFAAAHDIIFLITPEHRYEAKVFAVVEVPASSEFMVSSFGAGEREEWICHMAEHSLIPVGNVSEEELLSEDARFLTLSTSAYSFKNARLLVVGVMNEYSLSS